MAIVITSKRDGFRRCGVAHSKEPTTHEEGRFSKEELVILEAEPMLTVEVTGSKKLTVPDSVKLIEASETLEALNELSEGDTRKGVLDAIAKRKGELTANA